MCSGRELSQRGLDVVVVDAAERLGEDTAAGSGGLITPSHCVPLAGAKVLRELPRILLGRDSMMSVRPRLDPALLRYAARAVQHGRSAHVLAGLRALRDHARASRALFAEMAADGIDIGLRHSGVLNVCNTEPGFARLVEEARMLEREGFVPEILEGAAVANVEPAIRADVAGAVLWREDDQCLPARLTPELGRVCAGRGVTLELGSTVVGFARDADGTVSGVRTSRGTIDARHVVLAAGARTPALGRMLGVHVPVEGGKGHHLDVHDAPVTVGVPMILHEDVLGVTSMGADLRIVGGMDFVGLDRAIDPRRIAGIYERVARYLRSPPRPGEGRATPWSGLRPCTPDGLPIVGRLRAARNVVVATGHAMLGLTLAPATGRDVARLVAGERDVARESPWLEQFTPARFGL